MKSLFDIRKQIKKNCTIHDFIIYLEKMLIQIEIEENDLFLSDKCISKKKFFGLDLELSQLNVNNLANKISRNFTDPNVMKSVSCIFKILTKNNELKESFENIKRIGEESANGIALTEDFTKDHIKIAHNFCVIKISTNKKAELYLIHEAYIGKNFINKMRLEGNYNFAYTYFIFNCNKPYVSNITKKCLAFCTNNNNPVTHLAIEIINPGISVFNILNEIDITDFLSIYMQILLATEQANYRYEYWHGDLHCNNVLIRETNEKNYLLKYTRHSQNIYIKNNGKIATIIDFGYASIKNENGQYFNRPYSNKEKIKEIYENIINGYLDKNVFEHFQDLFVYSYGGNINYPIHDAYKFLCNSISIFNNFNRTDIANELMIFLNFFDFETDLKEEVKYRFLLPPIKEYLGLEAYQKYIDFCIEKIEKFDIFETNIENKHILDCGNCESYEDIIKEIGITDIPNPQTISEFIETYNFFNKIYENYPNEKNKLNLQNIIDRFNFENIKKEFENLEIFEVYVLPISDDYDGINKCMFGIGDYMLNMDDIANFLDMYSIFELKNKQLEIIKKIYPTSDNVFNIFIKKYNKIKENKKIIEETLKNNIQILNIIFQQNTNLYYFRWKEKVSKNEITEFYNFYRKKYPEILELL